MLLLAYIHAKIGSTTISEAQRDNLVGVRKSLAAYVGEHDVDLLQTALDGWVEGYERFLRETYRSNKGALSDKAVMRYMTLFRGVIRGAIAEGVFPNIDVFSDIELSETKKLGVTALKLSESVSKLAAHDYGKRQDLFDSYLLCMFLCGVEFVELSEMASDVLVDDCLTLRHLNGLKIKLSDAYSVAIGNSLAQVGELRVPSQPGFLEACFFQNGLKLYRSRSVFSDWLCLAREMGLSEWAVKELIALRFTDAEPTRQLAECVGHIARQMFDMYDHSKKHWYVGRCYWHNGEDILARNLAHKTGSFSWRMRQNDIYLPYKAPSKKSGEKQRHIEEPAAKVLSNMIFFHVTRQEIGQIDNETDNLWILRHRDDDKEVYRRIPFHEVYRLQLVLGSLDSCQASDLLSDDEIKGFFSADELAAGQLVTVNKPGYEGYEARVIKKMKKNYYVVSFTRLNLNFVLMNVPRALIHPI